MRQLVYIFFFFFFFQAEDGIRDKLVTGVQTCALPIYTGARLAGAAARAAPLLMEEREVGARVRAARAGHSRFLGAERLPHAGRPLEGGAVRGPRADAARDQPVAESQQEVSR